MTKQGRHGNVKYDATRDTIMSGLFVRFFKQADKDIDFLEHLSPLGAGRSALEQYGFTENSF